MRDASASDAITRYARESLNQAMGGSSEQPLWSAAQMLAQALTADRATASLLGVERLEELRSALGLPREMPRSPRRRSTIAPKGHTTGI